MAYIFIHVAVWNLGVSDFWLKTWGAGCFLGYEVMVYFVVNDAATDMA